MDKDIETAPLCPACGSDRTDVCQLLGHTYPIKATTSREALQSALDSEPHYVIHLGTGWHSESYPNRAEAQSFIDGYRVTQAYKDANYRVVNAREYWERHNR